MELNQSGYSISELCKCAKISRASYYKWLNRKETQAIVALSVRIIKVIYVLCTKKENYSHEKVHGLKSYQKAA